MGVDLLVKRYFPAILCALLAIAAYFQASGVVQLVASAIAADPAPRGGAASRGAVAPQTGNLEHATSAEPILSRNPFDSVTGPLDGSSVVLPARAAAVSNGDPYEDPPCDGAGLQLVVQGDDPEWSFATMTGSDGNALLRRKGDAIAGRTVFHVGWDRVWLSSDPEGSRCQVLVGGKAPAARAGAGSGTTTPAPREPASPSTSKRGSPIPPEIAAKIRKISDTEFAVERSAIDQILERQSELMRSVRIAPDKEGDKVVGFRLMGVRPDSLLGSVGLQTGDRVSTINGFELTDPQKALEAYARLRSADRLTVSVVRGGKPINIDLSIK